MKHSIYYLFTLAICLLHYSCKEEVVVGSTTIDRVTQTSIIFDDASTQLISDKEIKQVFYLVRHSEKDTVKKDDPILSEIGEKRSEELSRILKQTRIDEVYSTIYMRTLMTGEPITKAKGLSIKPYDPKELKAFAEQLKSRDEIKSTLIIGHSNTTPQMVAFLADIDPEELPKIDESDYDNFYIVVVHQDGTVNYNNYKFIVNYE